MPEASRPGSSTSVSFGPPRPVTSMMSTAASSGDWNRNDTAAKVPAAASTVTTCGGASLRARRIVRTPRPEPRAISGASGPSTIPSPIVASAARRTPGRVTGRAGPPAVERPFAGMCPPSPGRRSIANAMIRPASASTGSDHHSGGPLW